MAALRIHMSSLCRMQHGADRGCPRGRNEDSIEGQEQHGDSRTACHPCTPQWYAEAALARCFFYVGTARVREFPRVYFARRRSAASISAPVANTRNVSAGKAPATTAPIATSLNRNRGKAATRSDGMRLPAAMKGPACFAYAALNSRACAM